MESLKMISDGILVLMMRTRNSCRGPRGTRFHNMLQIQNRNLYKIYPTLLWEIIIEYLD